MLAIWFLISIVWSSFFHKHIMLKIKGDNTKCQWHYLNIWYMYMHTVSSQTDESHWHVWARWANGCVLWVLHICFRTGHHKVCSEAFRLVKDSTVVTNCKLPCCVCYSSFAANPIVFLNVSLYLWHKYLLLPHKQMCIWKLSIIAHYPIQIQKVHITLPLCFL